MGLPRNPWELSSLGAWFLPYSIQEGGWRACGCQGGIEQCGKKRQCQDKIWSTKQRSGPMWKSQGPERSRGGDGVGLAARC